MKIFLKISAALIPIFAVPAALAGAPETEISDENFSEKSGKNASADAESLIAARKRETLVGALRETLERRDAFFAEAENLPENERSRRAEDVAERFAALVARFPNAVPALYFFAEFLRDGGESERAEELLLKAEKIEPKFAPAQFLLAEILAARGEAESAFPRFATAIYEDPGNAHRRGVFAEFLIASRERLLEKKCFETRAELDAKMQSEFLIASALEPKNFDALWRYAESFYDTEAPDWSRALAAWERAERRIPPERRAALAPAVKLHRARALAELGKFDAADALLRETADVPALERSRRKVFEILDAKRRAQ